MVHAVSSVAAYGGKRMLTRIQKVYFGMARLGPSIMLDMLDLASAYSISQSSHYRQYTLVQQ